MNTYKITTSGQFSLPATIRRRWQTRHVQIEDRGDHVVVRPMPDDPIDAVRGIFKDRMKLTTVELRRLAREDEQQAEVAKHRRYYGK